MKTRVAAIAFLSFVTGCRTIEPAPPPDAPKIGSFTASKSRVASGESVTLSFTTSNATKVEIIDDAGRQVVLSGDVASGTATVAPVDTSFYVLRASGVGGRDTAFLQIAVNAPLKDLFLIAVPAAIESGQQAQLLWGAAGASSVTLTTGTGTPVALTGTTGSVTVTPATSERYTLTAQGAPGTPPLTALADVQVRPVLVDAQLTSADGVAPTKTLSFRWNTAGAQRVTLSEQTFGQLVSVTDNTSVVNGTYDFVIPATLPSGIAVSDGLPLRFTVTATADVYSVNKVLTAVVGDQPTIELFTAPAAATTGSTFPLAWRTLNATAIEVRVGNLPVWSTLPAEVARVAEGTVSLPTPTTQTEYTFIARNDRGAQATRVFTVRPVGPPVINTFTLTPTITTLGDAATARWTTTDAVRVQLQQENGPVLHNVTTPSQVASGNFGLLLAASTRIVLVATNAAGQSVSETRTFTFTGAVTVSPTPALRGSSVTLNWTLAPATVTEVVGLPTPPPAALPGSANYLDLANAGTATELQVVDPTDGVERVPFPTGFHFPLLGAVKDSLWVSVNGFVSFANIGGRPTNEDLSVTNSVPSMLAPFWDDLTMGPNSKILVDTTTSTLGERILVVQWEKLQLSGDANTSLSFQVQLYETGQVSFIYGALTGSGFTSATIGVQDTSWPVAQQYAFNSMTIQPTPGLELNWFSGAPADGMLTFNAGASRHITFIGRTPMNLVGASADTRTFAPGDVTVTEVMPLPESSVTTTGQWVEIHNTLPGLTNIGGLQIITSLSVDGGLFIPDDTWVDGGGYYVVGQSTDALLNGGANVAVSSDDLLLGMPGSASVNVGGSALSAFSWDAGVAGTSIAARDPVMLASGITQTCPRVATFGANGALGTPGASNERCTPYAQYVVTSIQGNFITAPANSTILSTISSDDGYGSTTLPQPFPYFGSMETTLGLSTNGFITLGYSLAGSYLTNDTTVSTSAPNGVLAILWDDLVRDTGLNAMWRLPDRTIVSWQGFRLIGTSPADTQINVQIHLLDNGTIEFHYGTLSTTLTAQSTIDRVYGNSATIWVEKQDGTTAVPFSINTRTLNSNMGLRFTPVP